MAKGFNADPHSEDRLCSKKSSPREDSSSRQSFNSINHDGRPRRLRGWGPELEGRYAYRSPTRLWLFEPYYYEDTPRLSRPSEDDVDKSLGKWRYEHGSFWIDWNPDKRATKLLLQHEELPPKQYQIMRELQDYRDLREPEIKQEIIQKCRQARLQLEKEAQGDQEVRNKKCELPLEDTNQAKYDRGSQKTAKGFKRFQASFNRFRLCIKQALVSECALPPTAWPKEFVVAPEDEPLVLKSERYRKRLGLIELEIKDDCKRELMEIEYALRIHVPNEMRCKAPKVCGQAGEWDFMTDSDAD